MVWIVLSNKLYQFNAVRLVLLKNLGGGLWKSANASDAGYKTLEEQVTRSRAINDGQPNWEAFRHYFRTEIVPSEEFKQELSRFQAELEEIKRDGEMK
jgi:hypothetical protein